MSPQLQSNLIPGLNLNALGLFPSGTPGMGPSMSSVPPPGAHGGYSFGVSWPPFLPIRAAECIFWSGGGPEAETLQDVGGQVAAAATQSSLEFHVSFFLSAVLMGLRGHFGPL